MPEAKIIDDETLTIRPKPTTAYLEEHRHQRVGPWRAARRRHRDAGRRAGRCTLQSDPHADDRCATPGVSARRGTAVKWATGQGVQAGQDVVIHPGGDTRHWRFVELGTQEHARRDPSCVPALENNIGKVIDELAKELKVQIDKQLQLPAVTSHVSADLSGVHDRHERAVAARAIGCIRLAKRSRMRCARMRSGR